MMQRTFFFLSVMFTAACGQVESTSSSANEAGAGGETNNGTEPSDETGVCCRRDGAQSGSMRLGGPTSKGCYVTHDFWCSTNWRVEVDESGCEVWRYDMRAPGPDETSLCGPKPKDAGSD